ncbi:hypothetical protein Pan181_37260 [Aeoliella mucimassa]|uniref:Uncharacterized protein n=1 Tax=Aeoliella mucimassa TaxID=2527972 RepID=A0A518AS03_9BACT|nr:hypothetical protein Pan181_37260 [Aeoliella mucimassa]
MLAGAIVARFSESSEVERGIASRALKYARPLRTAYHSESGATFSDAFGCGLNDSSYITSFRWELATCGVLMDRCCVVRC